MGKTTLIKEIVRHFGEKAGGFYTEEVRKEDGRTGFKIITLDGEIGTLASINVKSPYKIGKYKVDLEDFEKVALPAIENALLHSKIIIIDEIGPMELFSKRFKNLVLKALDSPNHVTATIKSKGSEFINKIKSRSDIILYNLTQDNKKTILSDILAHKIK